MGGSFATGTLLYPPSCLWSYLQGLPLHRACLQKGVSTTDWPIAGDVNYLPPSSQRFGSYGVASCCPVQWLHTYVMDDRETHTLPGIAGCQ